MKVVATIMVFAMFFSTFAACFFLTFAAFRLGVSTSSWRASAPVSVWRAVMPMNSEKFAEK
jgi:hypothetical protein